MAGQKETATQGKRGPGWEDGANENIEMHSRQKGNPKNVSKPGAEISYSQISHAGFGGGRQLSGGLGTSASLNPATQCLARTVTF